MMRVVLADAVEATCSEANLTPLGALPVTNTPLSCFRRTLHAVARISCWSFFICGECSTVIYPIFLQSKCSEFNGEFKCAEKTKNSLMACQLPPPPPSYAMALGSDPGLDAFRTLKESFCVRVPEADGADLFSSSGPAKYTILLTLPMIFTWRLFSANIPVQSTSSLPLSLLIAFFFILLFAGGGPHPSVVACGWRETLIAQAPRGPLGVDFMW